MAVKFACVRGSFLLSIYKTVLLSLTSYGLSCSKDPWILNRFLEYAMDFTLIRRQDAILVLQYVGREEYGRDVAWAFLVNNLDQLRAT